MEVLKVKQKIKLVSLLFLTVVLGAISILAVSCTVPAKTATESAEETAAPATEGAAATEAAATEAAAGEERQPVDIYLVQYCSGSWDTFWVVVENGENDAARDLGVNITIVAPSEWDPEQTAKDIDRAIAANPDGLGVTIADGAMFEEPMLRAINAGIPTISYNGGDERPEGEQIPVITYIGQDNGLAGYKAGLKMVAAHPGAKHGVAVNHHVGLTGQDKRSEGFVNAMVESGLKGDILSCGDDPAEAATIIGDYYTANPDVDLWLTQGPLSATAFYTFMEAEGLKAGDIFHGTFDLSVDIAAGIKNGTTDFGIDQGPYMQGYLTVLWLTWINRYGIYPPEKITSTGPGFIDKNNIEMVEAGAGVTR
jgi:simple sugar transport system substrate-binding protein